MAQLGFIGEEATEVGGGGGGGEGLYNFGGEGLYGLQQVKSEDSIAGGHPRWVEGVEVDLPIKCGVCNNNLYLLLQLNTDTDVLRRNLYVRLFACVRSKCQGQTGSWRALRVQKRWNSLEQGEQGKPSQSSKSQPKPLFAKDDAAFASWGCGDAGDWDTADADAQQQQTATSEEGVKSKASGHGPDAESLAGQDTWGTEETGDTGISDELLSLQQKVHEMKLNAAKESAATNAEAESEKSGKKKKRKGKSQASTKAGLDVGAAEFVPVGGGQP
eukprot:763384-Hanusia_phi.AAC.1